MRSSQVGSWQKPATEAGTRSTRFERWLVHRLLAALGDPPICFELWDGELVAPPATAPVRAKVRVHDRGALIGLLIDPELKFGEGYTAGRIEVDGNLVELMEVVISGLRQRRSGRGRRPIVSRILRRRPRTNSLTGSNDNIHHHYDLGNPFYRLWLDEAMLYTCAYFASSDLTLEEAQQAKMELVCRKLELAPGQQVVEAGCGWGSLALYMARSYGVSVRAFNISHEQIVYAQEQARRQGLENRVQFIEEDYRNIEGLCDRFVSVGMLEHVGRMNYRRIGEVADRCLNPDGRGFIHTIGRNRASPLNAWVERYIFPGAYPPTLREMMEIFEPYDFSILDVENLRLHYAQTLAHWLERYEASSQQVRAMFDEEFVRAWRLYLAGSQAAFTAGSMQLFQLTFARGSCNRLPPTRAHLYSSRATVSRGA